MKATGIVRRIDDLGRIVIPKEIRRTLRIKEGDPLEIFTDREGEVILKKYSQVGELGKFAAEFAESLAQTSGHGVCITDRDQIVAAAGGMKKEYIGKTISDVLENMINERESILAGKTPERQNGRNRKRTCEMCGRIYGKTNGTVKAKAYEKNEIFFMRLFVCV